MNKERKLNGSQIATATIKLRAVKLVQQDLETYIKGCMDGLELKGDWQLDMDTWKFTPVLPGKGSK